MGQEHSHDYFVPPHSFLARVPLDMVRNQIIYSRRLERLWMFIEARYSDPDIHLNDAAKCSGVSTDHLNLLLRQFADTTFHDLLSRYRIEKCVELLHEKNYTLIEVYIRCGFNSPTTFGRQFKKWVGCLPSEYKKIAKQYRKFVDPSHLNAKTQLN
jgi:AraC-like DNA-binding protein